MALGVAISCLEHLAAAEIRDALAQMIDGLRRQVASRFVTERAIQILRNRRCRVEHLLKRARRTLRPRKAHEHRDAWTRQRVHARQFEITGREHVGGAEQSARVTVCW